MGGKVAMVIFRGRVEEKGLLPETMLSVRVKIPVHH